MGKSLNWRWLLHWGLQNKNSNYSKGWVWGSQETSLRKGSSGPWRHLTNGCCYCYYSQIRGKKPKDTRKEGRTKLMKSKQRGEEGTGQTWGPQRAAEGVEKAEPGGWLRHGRLPGRKLGPRRRRAGSKAEAACAWGGAPKRERRIGPKGRRPRRAPGPRENRRKRPENVQEAATQPRPGSLIQAAFPSPFSNPMRSWPPAGARLRPTLHPGPPRGGPSPWDAGAPRCKVEQRPYLSSPGLNRSPSPPSPPRSAITEGRVLPPAASASPIGRADRQSRATEAEIAEICEMTGQTFYQSSSWGWYLPYYWWKGPPTLKAVWRQPVDWSLGGFMVNETSATGNCRRPLAVSETRSSHVLLGLR